MDKNSTQLNNDKKHWVSIEDFNNNPLIAESKKHEFQAGVTDSFTPADLSPISRRKFLALSAAAAAFATTSCTDYHDKGEIIPYNSNPEDVLPGIANYYASTFGDGTGILVKTREGRPIKIDGNPDNPVSKGKTPIQVQAAILDLYDPDRIRFPQKRSESELILFRGEFKEEKWIDIDKDILKKLNSALAAGKEIAIIANSIQSPTQTKLFNEFQAKYPTSKVYSFDLFNNQNKIKSWELCYGSRNIPNVDIAAADVILSLEFDFLGSDKNSVENIRQFASRRDIEHADKFNRLYTVEGGFSATGLNADYRMRLNPLHQLDFVLTIINEIYKSNAANLELPELRNLASSYSSSTFAEKSGINDGKIKLLINDLIKSKGKSIVMAGDSLPVEVHIAVNLLNEILGNSVLYNLSNYIPEFVQLSSEEEVKNLIDKMKSGNVAVLIHFDSNPVYHFPPKLGYEAAMKKVPTIIAMTSIENESSEFAHYLLPINHDLESWGIYQIRSSFLSLQQPVISPIYKTRQKEAVLLNWTYAKPEDYSHDIYHKYLMSWVESDIYPMLNVVSDFKKFWYSSLHDGIINLPQAALSLAFNPLAATSIKSTPQVSGYTLHLTNNCTIGNGEYANNGWLQEMPHPVSKVTWDNYAAIAPQTAKELGLKNNDLIEISVPGTSARLPVLVQPGLAEKLISAELGWGRRKAGTIGSNVGVNLIPMLNSISNSSHIISSVTVKKIPGEYMLASTQEHHALDDTFVKDMHLNRGIIQEGTVANYIKHPGFLHEGHEEHEFLYGKDGKPITIIPEVQYTEVKWGMAIDLNKCVGCNLCVASCNVENNIPVVGKDQTSRGREMQWIRIDRYYSGTPEEPQPSLQPMLCQHCDKAPCENVCPVVATTHSPDGLNQMAYNRCVGTRYCANNCPYKVRRFNFYDFRDMMANGYYYEDSLKLAHNPEVTVRSRGVMEKCTFCIQRIMEARQEATKQGRTVRGTDVKTACQEACPANAITFGDLNDPNSDVSKLRKHKLGYHVMELLNIRPNVTYIAKLRNTNSEEA